MLVSCSSCSVPGTVEDRCPPAASPPSDSLYPPREAMTWSALLPWGGTYLCCREMAALMFTPRNSKSCQIIASNLFCFFQTGPHFGVLAELIGAKVTEGCSRFWGFQKFMSEAFQHPSKEIFRVVQAKKCLKRWSSWSFRWTTNNSPESTSGCWSLQGGPPRCAPSCRACHLSKSPGWETCDAFLCGALLAG